MTKKKTTEAKKIAEKLFSLMGVDVKISVSEDKKNEAILVDIDAGDATGLIIGNRGETINAIQTVLGMMLKQSSDEWIRVIVNVGDWREKNEERLNSLAEQTKERVVQTGEKQPLYNLSAAERRVIHTYFTDDKEVETESEGEDQGRYLVVKPK